jgi:hypothetical protein
MFEVGTSGQATEGELGRYEYRKGHMFSAPNGPRKVAAGTIEQAKARTAEVGGV